jgi:hypothetical protein
VHKLIGYVPLVLALVMSSGYLILPASSAGQGVDLRASAEAGQVDAAPREGLAPESIHALLQAPNATPTVRPAMAPTPTCPFGSARSASPNPLWTGISADNGPSPRYDHTAVWTGTEMLVWGGQSYRSRTSAGGTGDILEYCVRNDGARFDPATNRWRPLSGMQAPSVRLEYASTWTGREFIIWGGAQPTEGVGPDRR